MPPLGPISRRELIAAMRRAGFSGPLPGSKHGVMVRGRRRLVLPNPHSRDISAGFLRGLLRQAGISRDEWEAL